MNEREVFGPFAGASDPDYVWYLVFDENDPEGALDVARVRRDRDPRTRQHDAPEEAKPRGGAKPGPNGGEDETENRVS